MIFAALEGATTFEAMGMFSVLGVSFLGLFYALFLARDTLRRDKGSKKIQDAGNSIKEGANAFLNRQFRTIFPLVVVLALGLVFTSSIGIPRAAAFLMGATFSALVGFIGMNMAIQGTMRVAAAANKGFDEALKIAYRAGTITGMLTDGLGLLGGTLIFLIYGNLAPEVLLGFGFGGTLIALFMRVGGGIYTKAADVGADIVGKIEKGIPEDDPRNAAVVADLVGDNVGDCAGMAADVFESYEVTIVSALILGLVIMALPGRAFELQWILFPLLVRAVGVVSSIIGTFAVGFWKTDGDAFKAMDRSYDLSSIISIISFFIIAYFYVGDLRVFACTTAGVFLAIGFNKFTSYFTNTKHKPVQEIAKSSKISSATVILTGLALGYESTVWAILIIAATIFSSIVIFWGAGTIFVLYGVALVGIGMLTMTGNTISMDVFGPISDNANGIGEMVGLDKKSRKILTDLDAAGNTTKAITKGIAIASAVLAAVSLFGSYIETTGLEAIGLNIADPAVFVGILVGASVPFLFSSLSIKSVGRAAAKIVEEVRRQFKIPGIMSGKKKPDYAKAVDICTTAAQKELISLALISVLMPIITGLLLGKAALGGFLAGIIVVGQLLAVFMSNAGGAWDNAKKYVEDGYFGGKGSEAHKASIIGDTVGDPLKDTAGPALNPMIKVVNLVALLLAPVIVAYETLTPVTMAVIAGMIAVVAVAIWYSKKEAFGDAI